MGGMFINIVILNMNNVFKVRVKDGCDVEDFCILSFCFFYSCCYDVWEDYSCICDKGYFGINCVDVCYLNFCENMGVCVCFFGFL